MGPADLRKLGLAELSGLLARQEVSSAAVVEAALARADSLEPRLNAFVTIRSSEARLEAAHADSEIARGRHRGPLHGVPVTIKDLFFTAGVRTTGGSKLFADWVPAADAALVERLRTAGAIILGKTNLDEFGLGGTSTLSHFGPVHNPWALDRMTGGSSGGSTAAVAAGIGPLSYGTETGSSVRRPASYCGVVGLKPTFGIISRHGSFRTAWSMDHVGVFARSVEDVALGLDAVAGYDARDPATVRQDDPAYASRLTPRVDGLRVAVLRGFLNEEVDPPVRRAFEAALELLAGLGARIQDIEVPEITYAAMVSLLTTLAEAGANHLHGLRERSDDYVPEVRRFLAAGAAMTAAEYLTVQRARQRIRDALLDLFGRVDLIAAPTTSRVAPLIAEGSKGNGDQPYRASQNQSNLLRFPSLLGLPALSLPCGVNPDGLPIGMQLIGRWFADQAVLNAAHAYWLATDWSARRPPLD